MSLKKVVGLLAGFALAVGLIGAGVGAVFTDSVTAKENINVGTFGCAISSTSPGAALGDWKANGYHSVTYTAPTITSSTGSAPFNFTVTSTGTIPVQVTVIQPSLSAPWSSLLVDPGAQNLTAFPNPGDSYTYNAGLAWAGLTNTDLGTSGSATWTVNCGEVPPVGVAYYAVNNGGTQFASGTWVRSTSPIASTAVVGGGTATQSVSGSGAVNLAITAGGPYADNGFYVPLGTVASLASSGYTVTGTGSQFGTNVYFDVNNDGSFFGWTSSYLTSIAPDTYGLGPTSVAGTLTVTGASTYAMTCNGTYGNYSLTALATTGCSPEGVTGTTKVAVWVGITSSGAALSTTITSAP